MVSVTLNKHQVKTRRITGWVLLAVVASLWMVLLLFAGRSSTAHHVHVPFCPPQGMKILYIVTSSNEYNTGDKETEEGQDRLLEILLPAVLDGVETMVQHYQVDVYLILGYQLSDQRRQLIQNVLPDGVGLEVWNKATPVNYEFVSRNQRKAFLSQASRVLARQHRYVVRDKLPYYDFLMAWEDDMLISIKHIDYYLEFQREIRRLKEAVGPPQAPYLDPSATEGKYDHSHRHWGNLTRHQLDHILPGFLRVEVLTNSTRPTQSNVGPIPVYQRARPDPRICCHGQHVGLHGKLAPQYPHSNELLIWETAIAGLSIRKMPSNSFLDWVAVLNIKATPNLIGGYWSGTDGALLPDFSKKPPTKNNEYIGQPAGWMATAQDIIDLNNYMCKGKSFLPPFDEPQMREDGMGFGTDSVEFWSGGLQLWGQMCELQRIVSLDPAQFSRHLIYHTANNKQKEIGAERLVKIPTLLGQLHTVKHRAEADMKQRLGRTSLLARLLSWLHV